MSLMGTSGQVCFELVGITTPLCIFAKVVISMAQSILKIQERSNHYCHYFTEEVNITWRVSRGATAGKGAQDSWGRALPHGCPVSRQLWERDDQQGLGPLAFQSCPQVSQAPVNRFNFTCGNFLPP